VLFVPVKSALHGNVHMLEHPEPNVVSICACMAAVLLACMAVLVALHLTQQPSSFDHDKKVRCMGKALCDHPEHGVRCADCSQSLQHKPEGGSKLLDPITDQQ